MGSRYAIRDRILALDPVTDHQEIVFIGGAYENPFIIQRALEFAMFRTFALPRTADLLDQTGEFAKRGQQRYDDTTLLISSFVENGYDSEEGRAAIRRMNQMHHRYPIDNEDYLYTLSTFIFEPIRWVQRFGWRPITDVERQAIFLFWCEVGRRMNIKDIPETYEAFEAFNRAYEEKYFHYSESCHRVGEATMTVYLNWYPAVLRPMVRRALYCFMDERLRESFGYPKGNPVLEALLVNGLKLRAKVIRFLPPRRQPRRYTQERSRTYPHGYTIEQLGPPDMKQD